jgi:putative tricarboxylic transport membrane protein
MRTAQILMTLAIVGFSASVMAQGIHVGAKWVDGQPGPGFFPFWLGALLFICGAILFARTVFAGEGGTAGHFFETRTAMESVIKVTVTATGMLVFTYLIGFRTASIIYLFVYLRFIGKHRWPATIAMSLLIPIAGYVVFERILQILLPRGIYSGIVPFID